METIQPLSHLTHTIPPVTALGADETNDASCVTRGVVVPLDPSPAQERMLRSYCGASRFAYNWAIDQVIYNMRTRSAEREAGVSETDLTPSISWQRYSLEKAFNAAKQDVAPWHHDVTCHSFYSGIKSAAKALENFTDSRAGSRKGQSMGFPKFKSRSKSKLSFTMTEVKRQSSWFKEDGHSIALILPKRRCDQLKWIHTTTSTRRLARKVAEGSARILSVTISFTGGHWQASFSVRYNVFPTSTPTKFFGGSVGIDLGISHLATLSRPVPGLTDDDGHIANPRHLDAEMRRLHKLDRSIARCEKGSKNRAKLKARRAKLHGTIAKTRDRALHELTTKVAGGFETIAIEDLNVRAMANKKHHLGRSLADASFGELRRQLTYKAHDRGATVVVIDRFFPSSKTCSSCSTAKATLSLATRTFECSSCGVRLDRDINAARNIAAEGARLLHCAQHNAQHVAGFRPETQNAGPRTNKTKLAHAKEASAAMRAEPRSQSRRLTPSA